MIITRTWLQEFINISKISTNDICKTLNSIGLEVDSARKISIPSKIVVGKVIQKDKHKDANKLSVCQIDIGSEVLQIVCGAQNVDVKQYVCVAKIGCELENGLRIEASTIRGVPSNGMLCSSTELGLPKLDDGILVLDSSIGKLVLGKELNLYNIFNDDIIEVELTPNRGDCLSINGIARELSTSYNLRFNEDEKSINHNDFGIGQILEIDCASDINSSLVFKAADFSKFCLPLTYKIRLALIDKYSGICINDVLSYVTHCVGIVLNAYAKEEASNKGDLSLLNIKKDENGFDCVYGDKLLNIIGIDNKVKNDKESTYIIQASYTNPEILNKKVFETKIKTGDSYYLSSRGSEPNIVNGIEYLSSMISKYGAKLYSGQEQFIEDRQMLAFDIYIEKINSIIGQDIPKVQMEHILNSLGFEIKDTSNGEILSIEVPLFRHDIKNIADIAEEIVRIVGIDNIKSKPLAVNESNRINFVSNNLLKKQLIRSKAVSNGFFETITYIFSSKELLQKYNYETVDEKKDILNPITQELNTYRTTQLLNLVEAVSSNQKQGFKKIALFEIGTIFNKNREEFNKISFIHSGYKENENFLNNGKPQNITFFEFAQKILNCIGEFELVPMQKISNNFIHPHQNATVLIAGKDAGYISKLHPNVANDFGLDDTFIAQIDLDMIKIERKNAKIYSKFQASKRDLSLIAPKNLPFNSIKKAIKMVKNENIKQFNLVDIYSDEKLGENQSLTIRFVLQNETKTMEEEDINLAMNQILQKLQKELGIGLR